jgi:hypothetical protein
MFAPSGVREFLFSQAHWHLAECPVIHASSFKSPGFEILTYFLTPLSRALLEKLTDSAASQEIHRIFGT